MDPERLRVALTVEQCWHRVPGGTAVAAIGMAEALRAEPIHVLGVAARHSHPARPPWTPPVEVRQLPLPRVLLYESWHYLRRPRVQTATDEVDVIHATSLAVPPRSAPLIVTIHDLAFLHDPSQFTKRGMRFFTRGLELARAEADLIVCPSLATLEDCEANGIAAGRLRHVPLGIAPALVGAEQVTNTKSKFELERPYVLWTGTIEPRKNLKRLLEAFAAVDAEVDLVLVGPRGWNEDIAPLVERDQRIKTLGFVDKVDLDALYAAARVFCWPSLLEGFGFPVLEALAQGAPVITSRGTSTEELAGDAALLVDPRDTDEISDALGKVLADDDLASRLGGRGPARAARFTWSRTAEKLMRAYSEIA